MEWESECGLAQSPPAQGLWCWGCSGDYSRLNRGWVCFQSRSGGCWQDSVLPWLIAMSLYYGKWPPQARASKWRRSEQALAGWLSWLEHYPMYQEIRGLIPSQGTYLDCRFDSQWGCVQEATDWCVSLTSISLSLFVSLLLSPSKVHKNIPSGENFKKSEQDGS